MNVNQIQAMKKAGEKSVALVVWDAPTAHIAHQCGADFLIEIGRASCRERV